MKNIIIEMRKNSCTLINAENGNYIKSFVRYSTAQKKAEELAKGGKITLQFIK